jgi:ADP-heptose:LPS heptosyltransferase
MYSRNSVCEDSIVRISGAIKKIGCVGDFVHAKSWEKYIFNRYYTELIDISPTTTFEFNKNKAFIEKVIATKISIRKPSLPSEPKPTTTMRYAVICPGALLTKKRWPLKNFIPVMDYLYAKYKISSILVGDHRDIPSAQDTRSLAECPYIKNLIGKTSLFQTTIIIQESTIVVSNDTCVSHIGVASDKPVVVISNGEHYGRFSEYPKEIYSLIFYAYPPEIANSMLSFNELVKKYQYGSRLNINSIQVETVQQLIDKALNPLEFN